MDQKLSLIAAGRLLGVTPNAVRARIKKNPELYRYERDNEGKIWVWLDTEKAQPVKVTSTNKLNEAVHHVEVSLVKQIAGLEAALATAGALKEAALLAKDETDVRAGALQVQVAVLDAQLSAAEARLAEATADRDHWRDLAMMLAAKPARRWWPF